jgi:hypothetical protein
MSYINHLVTSDSITLLVNNQTKVYSSEHPSFGAIKDALKAKDFNKVLQLTNHVERVENFGEGKISVRGGIIYYGNFPVDNSLSRRILQMQEEGFDINPMILFLENLMNNPSNRSVEELYTFMEVNNLPITEDGYLLAYKRVTEDWKDFYSRTLDNSLGSEVKMPRNQVDDDSSHTCSRGLHFCSLAYLKSYHNGQGRIVIVKINPADVVSIPRDYKNSKGRCCRYWVVATHEGQHIERFQHSVYSANGEQYTAEKNHIAPASTTDVTMEGFAITNSETVEDDGFITIGIKSTVVDRIPTPPTSQAVPAPYYTREQACKILNISRDALRKRLAKGSSVAPVFINGKEFVKIIKLTPSDRR